MDLKTYVHALNAQLSYLFAYACRINEIDTAAALSGEFRGMQDAGWNTVATAHEVFHELMELAQRKTLNRAELRQMLCLYAQLAEAGGVYEGLLNIMQVAQLKAYNLWPFQDLVRVRKAPPAVIGPNANAMFRRLAGIAVAIGMTGLAQLLEMAFRDDIRNAMAHADYILTSDGLRLPRRNGGAASRIPHADVMDAIEMGLLFFQLLHAYQGATAASFRPARVVIGRFSANPPMSWKIELADDGRFSISTESAGSQVDAAYMRQSQINDRLGGRIVTAYIAPGIEVPHSLLSEILVLGFDVQVVEFDSSEKFTAILADVEKYRLWDGPAPHSETIGDALLMVTPFGFRRVSAVTEFAEWLPAPGGVEFG